MSSLRDEHQIPKTVESLDRTERPIVGVFATPGDSDAALRSVVRAHAQGFDAVVGSIERIDDELERLLRRIGPDVTFVTAADRTELRRRLSEFRDKTRYPEIIYHDPDERMDFEASYEKLRSDGTAAEQILNVIEPKERRAEVI